MAPKKEFPGILIKRGKIWHYQVYVPGRGLWKRTTGKTNHRQAEAEARKLYAQALLLSESPEELPTLSKAIVKEVTRVAEQTSERQAERIGINLSNFLAWAGDLTLEKIDTKLLTKYQRYRIQCKKMVNRKGKRVVAKCNANVSPSTINREVQSILRLLKENGFPGAKPLPLRGKQQPGRPFSHDELGRFFMVCNEYPQEDPGRYTPLFLLLLCTGARPAELIPSSRSNHVALLKREIDYKRGTILIRSAKLRRGSRSKSTTLRLSAEVLAAVKKMAEKTPGAHVFFPLTLNCVFNRILKKAGITQVDELGEKLTAHSFRHTFGTMLAEQGANAFVIQNILRHSDPKMTSRYVERATQTSVIDVSKYLGGQEKEDPDEKKGPEVTGAGGEENA